MSRRWIRLDVDWEDSAWLDGLTGQAAGCWPRLLCWVKLRGKKGRCKAPDHSVLARRWRVPRQAVDELVAAAIKDNALEADGGDLVVVNWDEYQEPDPTAAARKRRQRAREAPKEKAESHATVTDVTRDTVTRPPTTDRDIASPSIEGDAAPPPDVNSDDGLHPEAAQALAALIHRGGTAGTAASLRTAFLYEDEGAAMPDPSVKGLALKDRRHVVSMALVEMRTQGVREWSPRALSGFVRKLRSTRPIEPPDDPGDFASREAEHRRKLEAETIARRLA